ncbi:MAG: multifunctional CCA tRNA nucleotidyl transferase/2'3'-cyclic phosphodiesterase/2'nucleotidase/phosphatase [Gammaproteobacteria bacterium]|nr:multifunctional CCA tRNA nucleotidyl transferase/2'3'-cyclic phosphodiesterase/2'nucleotidase/phosphatase [Gammaproteobacteria bacterium]
MEVFLVGGAVRDFLLAKINGDFKTPADVNNYWMTVEKDWVVVNSAPEEMLALGYRRVGKSFPVFLHPDTKEEHALARTERKVAKGYTGFECYAEKDVTLEEDLQRRDLTINAIAMRVLSPDFSTYELIDPYQGEQDLKNRLFRHISPAFAEDPVRVLRVARLAARFGNFEINSDTLLLMKKMVAEGEIDALVPERVWQEWARSLQENYPWRFFDVLENCNAQQKLFPEIKNFAVKQKILMKVIEEHPSDTLRFAIEVFDMDEHAFLRLINQYRIPTDFRDLALIVIKYYPFYTSLIWESETILTLFERTDAFRRRHRFNDFLMICHYLAGDQDKIKSSRLLALLTELTKIDNAAIGSQGFKGEAFAAKLREIRIATIDTYLQ